MLRDARGRTRPKAFESGGVWIGRFKDGKLAEVREESDVIGWMQQLGMELKPIEAKKK
jgi:hypothetical protein